MNTLKKLLLGEPVALAGVGAAVVTLCAALHINTALLVALGGVLTAVMALVRQLVVPNQDAAAAVTKAAATAATHVAQNLTKETVGTVGEVTEAASGIVDAATAVASNAVLTAVGLSK